VPDAGPAARGGTAGRRRRLTTGMETTVIDVPESDRFEIRDGDRVLGLAAYQRRGDTFVFHHTEVDPDAGQSGLGSTLVRAALDEVRSQGGSVVPSCSFVAGWIERHPDYADLVADRDA
jgi:predicted GNAT family acetyltransferase